MNKPGRINLVSLCVSGLAVLVGLAVCMAGATHTSAQDSKTMAAYFGMFDGAYDEAMAVADQIPWDKVNRVYIAFATVQDGQLTDIPADGDTSAEERITNLVTACREANATAEIFIVSNYGDEVTKEYLNAAKDPSRFADSVLDYLQRYGLDGYDMDWESTDIDDYADDLRTLLSTTYDMLKAAGPSPASAEYKLTHTVWPGVHSPSTVAAISDYVDSLNLMTYGPGSEDDLSTYASQYADAGVPYEKMLAGLEAEFGYSGVDTQDSVAAKAQFVAQNNLGGMFVWRMENDMRTQDGENTDGPPTYQVTGWMYDALTQ